jgi:WD40 repeat protein
VAALAVRDALLSYKGDWTETTWEQEGESAFRVNMTRVLERIQHRHFFGTAHRTLIAGYHLTQYVSNPFNFDGSKLLMIHNWDRTSLPKGRYGIASDLVIWDIIGRCEYLRLKPRHEGPVIWAGFSPDGMWIATSSWDGHVRVWEAMTGALFHTFGNASMHQSWNGQFSPDSELLAVGNGDGNLRIWEIRTGRLKYRLSLSGFEDIHDHMPLTTLSPIRGVSFSSDSNNVFISGGHGKTSLFKLSTCELLQRFTALRSQDGLLPYEITDLSISHNGNRIGFQTPNGDTFVYDMRSNEKWRIEQTLDSERACRKAVGSNLCLLDDAGETALTTDLDGNTLIWKISDSNSEDWIDVQGY